MPPTIVANGEVPEPYLREGFALLEEGGPALDAVQKVAERIEADPGYNSAGVGGLPTILGHVELDAMLMNGDDLAAGAVAGIRSFPHPVRIARAVMRELPHVCLIAEGAERFAREHGFQEAALLTDASRNRWEAMLATLGCKVPRRGEDLPGLTGLARRALEKHLRGDTMFAMAIDSRGSLAVAVSTSGISWKYPGRVGDSPVPGAGGYADSRRGAAAATGLGELMLRTCGSVRAVTYMECGLSPEAAASRTLGEVIRLARGPKVRLAILTPDGRVTAAATYGGAAVSVIRQGTSGIVTVPCTLIEGV